jgi:hypothetical protein
MAENFSSLLKDMSINIQEVQRTPSRMNPETHIEAHYKSKKDKGKGRILNVAR